MKPKLSMSEKPKGLTFRTPESALERWDPTLVNAKSAASDEGEISILSEIGPEWMGGVSASMVKTALAGMNDGPVRIILNSPGGDAFEGIAIYNLISDHPGKVTVHVLGMAASAASIVAMAGDRIEMGEASMLMIHSAWGLVIGNADDMGSFKEFLDKIDASVAELYANRSGQDVSDVVDMMKKETWMTAKEAVDEGFADVALAKDSKKKKGYAEAAVATFKKSIFALKPNEKPLAALGDQRRFAVQMSTHPGASGKSRQVFLSKGTTQMKPKIAEQIATFEAKRAASVARMEEIMSVAADAGSTLDEAQSQEYETLAKEVETIDKHLVLLKKHEAAIVARATAIPAAATEPSKQTEARGGAGAITVRANIEKGIPFTRYVKALVFAKGNPHHALQIAQANKQWHDQTPQVEQVLMAAVAGGDTTTAGWASELVYAQNLANEFIEFLRPQTIIGRISNLTPVPFNVRVAGANAGSTGFWVGQGKPVPLSKMGTFAVTLGIAKAAGIVVLDQELIRSSQPSAELLVRNDLAKAVTQVTDVQFVDPGAAGTANVSPASVTSGVDPTPATGTTAATLRADVQTLFGKWITQNLDPSGGVWIMTPMQALAISLMLNALGQPVFQGPGNTINMNGGTFFGLPVITSMSAQMVGSPVAGEGQLIILLNAPEVLLADDGQVTVDASTEASLEMLDNPTNLSTGATAATSMISMYQTNSVAIKALRFINWAKRRSIACQYIKDAAYVS